MVNLLWGRSVEKPCLAYGTLYAQQRVSPSFAENQLDLDEDLTITCGDKTAKIVNGKLMVGDKDRRAVKPGNTIKFNSSGKLTVNGEER
jgi:hypothetical protein